MGTQLVKQEEVENVQPGSWPLKRRITYRLTFALKIWRFTFSLVFSLVIDKLRTRGPRRVSLPRIVPRAAQPLLAEEADLAEASDGDSTSGIALSVAWTITKSEDPPPKYEPPVSATMSLEKTEEV